MERKTRLLVSVRSVAEAREALAGGADLIDVKEPNRGSLGRADDDVLDAIVREVDGRCPVSAAMGELTAAEIPPVHVARQLTFIKWGLAGYAPHDWKGALSRFITLQNGPKVVAVAYADWKLAHAPRIDDVSAFACRRPGSVLLVDTWRKLPGDTLLGCLSADELTDLCTKCQGAGVGIALAGSLGLTEIRRLRAAAPTWFAVRGAVCAGRERTGSVRADKVRELSDLLDGFPGN
jgi:uncharacterized protein (UPF0264 family)